MQLDFLALGQNTLLTQYPYYNQLFPWNPSFLMANEKKAAVKTLNAVSLSLSETKQGYWIIAKVIIKCKGCYNSQFKIECGKMIILSQSFCLHNDDNKLQYASHKNINFKSKLQTAFIRPSLLCAHPLMLHSIHITGRLGCRWGVSCSHVDVLSPTLGVAGEYLLIICHATVYHLWNHQWKCDVHGMIIAYCWFPVPLHGAISVT